MTVTISRTIDAKPFTIPFRELIKKYPSLNAFLVSSNPPKFDLGDTSVLSIVNKHLFHALLGLDISVPPSNLIPTIGLRHAYCSSVLSTTLTTNTLLEIGVGSSAAIILLFTPKEILLFSKRNEGGKEQRASLLVEKPVVWSSLYN